MELGWRVDELAERRGWTAQRLAEKSGLDVKTVRNIVNGRATRVDLETIRRLVDALGVEPGALWRRTSRSSRDRWAATAGAAGTARGDEIAWILRGRWDQQLESPLVRASRP
jgi:transcriptional regulator with XRE-family HTH domain